MEKQEKREKNKGGRRPVENKMDQLIPVKCTAEQREEIQERAAKAGMTVSEYLREIGTKGRIEKRLIVFPKEVLQLTGNLNHLAANLNQIAKRRNSFEQLSSEELLTLRRQSEEVKDLATLIKSYFS
jgi:Ribbon-helix-helix protein, copG family.